MNKPVEMTPSPDHPALQAQEKVPGRLEQVAAGSSAQLSLPTRHSSISMEKKDSMFLCTIDIS